MWCCASPEEGFHCWAGATIPVHDPMTGEAGPRGCRDGDEGWFLHVRRSHTRPAVDFLLHVGMLVREWGMKISDSDLDEQSKADPLPLLESLGKSAKWGCATTVLEAVAAIQWTGADLSFLPDA